jgi:hypothetical protein
VDERERRSSSAGIAEVLDHPMVRRLSLAVARRVPQVFDPGVPTRRAAVALILRASERGLLELLMIRRAE